MPFPSPETVAQHIADTLAAAEFLPLSVEELNATASRLFWNGGDLDRAIGDVTDVDQHGPGWWGLLTYDAASKEAGRPALIAARHERAAASIDQSIASAEQTIREKQARLASVTAPVDSWLTFDNDPLVEELTSAISGLRASIPAKRAAAAQLRARAAELTSMKAAA